MDKVYVIGPNKRATEHAKYYELVPREAHYIGTPEGIRGLDQSTVYVVDYGYREGQAYSWNSRTNDRRRQEMLNNLIPARATIKYVELP